MIHLNLRIAQCTGVVVLDPEVTLRKQRIHRAVVLEGKELVGIVTATDIMRAVAEHRV